ncbi:alpha/beta hydrolase [Alteromonadales bacterium alter-6D02]|nr:alpha/beta hydrolase [Alteromonadales bacterium alter-6D02]
MKVIFSHGKESGPWGSKITQLASIAKELGFTVDSIDYTQLSDPDQRVDKLNSYLTELHEPYVLVGSSMGGYVSLVSAASHQPQGLFLLAPALFMPDYQQQTYLTPPCPVEIIHGWADDVIPVAHSIQYAQRAQCTLHLIDGDHRLNSSLEQVCELFRAFLIRIKPTAT